MRTTSSQQIFPWFWQCWWGTKISSQMWIHMAETSYIYIYIVTYLDYVLFLLEFVDYWLPLDTVRFWNPFQDSLMEFSHTRTLILLRFKSHRDVNPIIDLTWNSYFGFQVWYLDLQPSYISYNLKIWYLWCSKLRPYKPLSWNPPTQNSIPQYLTIISSGL